MLQQHKQGWHRGAPWVVWFNAPSEDDLTVLSGLYVPRGRVRRGCGHCKHGCAVRHCRWAHLFFFSLCPGKYLKLQTFSLLLLQPRPSHPCLPPSCPPLHHILRFAQEVILAPPSKRRHPHHLPVEGRGGPRHPRSWRTTGAIAAAASPVVTGDPRIQSDVPASKC